MPKKKLFGFITDPFESFRPEMDNSLCLMREIKRRGHDFLACEPKDLFLKQGELWGTFKRIELTGRLPDFFRFEELKTVPVKKFDVLFLRKDPPVDLYYLQQLYFLIPLEKEILIVNRPSAVLHWNEKLSVFHFPFAPKTLVSADVGQILAWAAALPEGVVVKPLNEGSGRGVIRITKAGLRDLQSESHLKAMTEGGRLAVVAQEFLPQIKTGDQRIVLWNGKVLTHFIRVPREGHFLANTAEGGRLEPYPLGKREKKIAAALGPWAQKNGLYLVGFDVIRPYLTEINITSPAGIQQGNAVYGTQVERKIIDDVLRWV